MYETFLHVTKYTLKEKVKQFQSILDCIVKTFVSYYTVHFLSSVLEMVAFSQLQCSLMGGLSYVIGRWY